MVFQKANDQINEALRFPRVKRGAGKFSFEKELLPWGLFEFDLADDVKNIKHFLLKGKILQATRG